jgi:hypothetical protein
MPVMRKFWCFVPKLWWLMWQRDTCHFPTIPHKTFISFPLVPSSASTISLRLLRNNSNNERPSTLTTLHNRLNSNLVHCCIAAPIPSAWFQVLFKYSFHSHLFYLPHPESLCACSEIIAITSALQLQQLCTIDWIQYIIGFCTYHLFAVSSSLHNRLLTSANSFCYEFSSTSARSFRRLPVPPMINKLLLHHFYHAKAH